MVGKGHQGQGPSSRSGSITHSWRKVLFVLLGLTFFLFTTRELKVEQMLYWDFSSCDI